MLPQNGARSGRKEALPDSGETKIHPSTAIVRGWADSIVSGVGIQESRGRVVETFQDLPEAIKSQELLIAYYRVIGFAFRHNLVTTLPVLTATAQQFPDEPTNEQLELLGFTGIVSKGTQSDVGEKLRVEVNLEALGTRIGHAEDFNGEDWLTSLAMITRHRGVQGETQAKVRVRDENLQYLLDLNPTAIAFDHISTMHGRVINAIYPNAHNTQTYREHSNNSDEGLMFVKDIALRMLATNPNASGRKQAIGLFLDQFNSAIASPTLSNDNSYLLTKLYAEYLLIHPHQDGNGTMIKTLIDYYTEKRGLPRIDWALTKTDEAAGEELENAFEEYVYGGEQLPLVLWFQTRIAQR